MEMENILKQSGLPRRNVMVQSQKSSMSEAEDEGSDSEGEGVFRMEQAACEDLREPPTDKPGEMFSKRTCVTADADAAHAFAQRMKTMATDVNKMQQDEREVGLATGGRWGGPGGGGGGGGGKSRGEQPSVQPGEFLELCRLSLVRRPCWLHIRYYRCRGQCFAKELQSCHDAESRTSS